MKLKISLFCLLLALISVDFSYGQYAKLRQAFIYAEDANTLDSAKILADEVVVHEGTMNDPQAWYLRALVNKQLVVKKRWSEQSLGRINACMQFVDHSIQLDPSAENIQINKDLIKGLAVAIDNKLHEVADTVHFRQILDAVSMEQQIALKLNPKVNQDSVAVHYFFLLGDQSKAEPFYSRVLVLKPNNWLANLKIGEIYLQQLQLEPAQVYLERAYQANPSNRRVLNSLSRLYNHQGDTNKSAQFRQLANDIGKDD